MLGKRRYPGNYPSGKRSTKNSYQGKRRYNYGGKKVTKQFGSGYNPKMPLVRAPPAGAERKFYDAAGAGTAWTAASGNTPTYHVITSMNNIAQGDGPNLRQGSKIMATKLTVRQTLVLDKQSTAGANWADVITGVTYRVIIGIDTQCNGAAPTLASLLDFDTANATLNAFNNTRFTGRFKILCDEFHCLNRKAMLWEAVTYTFNSASVEKHFDRTFNLNLPIQYSDGTNNTTAIATNNLFMIVLANNSTGSQLLVPWRFRLRFTDY